MKKKKLVVNGIHVILFHCTTLLSLCVVLFRVILYVLCLL